MSLLRYPWFLNKEAITEKAWLETLRTIAVTRPPKGNDINKVRDPFKQNEIGWPTTFVYMGIISSYVPVHKVRFLNKLRDVLNKGGNHQHECD